MPELEISELIILIVCTVPLAMSYWIIKARKDILKYFPSGGCLYLTFLFTNLEALILPDFFNFLEHFCLMLAGIFMFLALMYDFYTKYLKNKDIKSKQVNMLVKK